MAVLIQEMTVEVSSSPGNAEEGKGYPDFREERLQQSLLTQLELRQERKARLVID